eukprot:Em0021g644a
MSYQTLTEMSLIAHKSKDTAAIARMTKQVDNSFDVFICINESWHAFVLCVPAYQKDGDPLGVSSDMPNDDPFAVPDLLLCWVFELSFERPELRMYKIRKNYSLFGDIKKRVKKPYYIGKYAKVNPQALQFAALRAAPHRYSVLLHDCVEFAKEYCICLLSYCNNYKDLEKVVHDRIAKATASGLSVEYLSRHFKSSTFVGNTFLGGLDVSTFFGGRFPVLWIVILLIVLLLYPIIVAVHDSANDPISSASVHVYYLGASPLWIAERRALAPKAFAAIICEQ